MARVVLAASGTMLSPGIARRTSSTVAPHRECHGLMSLRYVPRITTAITAHARRPINTCHQLAATSIAAAVRKSPKTMETIVNFVLIASCPHTALPGDQWLTSNENRIAIWRATPMLSHVPLTSSSTFPLTDVIPIDPIYSHPDSNTSSVVSSSTSTRGWLARVLCTRQASTTRRKTAALSTGRPGAFTESSMLVTRSGALP